MESMAAVNRKQTEQQDRSTLLETGVFTALIESLRGLWLF